MIISNSSQYLHTLQNIETNYDNLTKVQNDLSSGTTIHVASDNPLGMAAVMQNNVQSANLTTDLNSLTSVSSNLENSVTTLTQIQDIVNSIQSLAEQANNTTTLSTTDQTLADQVNTDLSQLLQIANNKLSTGQYMFGGTAGNKPPFVVTATDDSGQPTSIEYQGADQSSNEIVSQGLSIHTLIPGDQVFCSQDRGTTAYVGSTGANAGTGTDSATGQGTLLVQHTLTTFAGSSGVSAGSSSATGDTIIGPAGASSLQINDTSGNGSAGTISLNGGPAVSFTNSDTNLEVTGPNGEVAYLNTTSIQPGFNGSVSLTATGTISTDGGATSTPIDFSGNQIVTNGSTGDVTNVDSTNIRMTGTDQVNYTGTSSLFQVLMNLRDTIVNKDGLSASDRSKLLGQQIAELQRLGSSVSNAVGIQSAQSQSLTQLQTILSNQQTNLAAETSNLQDTNMATAVVELQQRLNVYQASLQVAAQLNQLQLANFMGSGG